MFRRSFLKSLLLAAILPLADLTGAQIEMDVVGWRPTETIYFDGVDDSLTWSGRGVPINNDTPYTVYHRLHFKGDGEIIKWEDQK